MCVFVGGGLQAGEFEQKVRLGNFKAFWGLVVERPRKTNNELMMYSRPLRFNLKELGFLH